LTWRRRLLELVVNSRPLFAARGRGPGDAADLRGMIGGVHDAVMAVAGQDHVQVNQTERRLT